MRPPPPCQCFYNQIVLPLLPGVKAPVFHFWLPSLAALPSYMPISVSSVSSWVVLGYWLLFPNLKQREQLAFNYEAPKKISTAILFTQDLWVLSTPVIQWLTHAAFPITSRSALRISSTVLGLMNQGKNLDVLGNTCNTSAWKGWVKYLSNPIISTFSALVLIFFL